MKQRPNKLFEPAQLKALSLQNRIVMAPMTRARTTQPGNIPNEMMATYYQQRASAGLIISEATQISDDSQGYSFTPGVYTDAQVAGWQGVTQAVKLQGAAMFVSYGMWAECLTQHSKMVNSLSHHLRSLR